MSILKRFVLVALLALFVMPVVGCGIGTTAAENRRSVARVANHDARMLVDDLMLFSQTDRPLRTSRWVVE